MIYADYAYYTDIYGGKAVSQEDFLRLAAEASAYLDRVTLGRAEEHSEDERLSGNSRGADVQAVSDLASCGMDVQRGG